ncbi:OmpH family outer membrane protein [Fluviicola sp.]|uniref:OmpH family outer membrane protein n=1 Tax=Fluviicola sp. TaxID=1917219 RepID=UPI00262D2574|nr:OmpH family outer membrane protein [Fluviicola sp.]
MKKIIIIILLLGVGLGIFGLGWYLSSKKEQVRYVSMSKVYLESDYYKKFQQDLKALETQSNAQLAGIQKDIRDYKAAGAEASFIKEMEDELLTKQEELTRQYEEKSKQFDEIIWGEINRSISEYGKKHGIDFILGAKGDGNIMYASDRCDITNELIEFIHKQK